MDKALIFIAMAGYMSIIIGIGFYYYKRSNESSILISSWGRSLGPWVAAISAGASDMSGWLLMGLPGVAYWSGLSDAFWTAIGLAAGTQLNWTSRNVCGTIPNQRGQSRCRNSSAIDSMRTSASS